MPKKWYTIEKRIPGEKKRNERENEMAEQEFEIENGKLIKYNGPGGKVVIPNGVKSIGGQAFYFCAGLVSVTVPNSVMTSLELAVTSF